MLYCCEFQSLCEAGTFSAKTSVLFQDKTSYFKGQRTLLHRLPDKNSILSLIRHLGSPMLSPLAASTLRSALMLYFIVAIGATAVQTWLEYKNEKLRLNAEIEHLLDTFEPILAQGFWNLDDENIDSTARGMLSNDFIYGLRILDPEGSELLALGYVKRPEENIIEVATAGSKKDHSKILPDVFGASTALYELFAYERDVYYEKAIDGRELVGKVVVYSSPDVVLQRVMYSFVITLANAMVKTFFLWIIFFIVLKRRIGEPMTQVSRAMQNLDLKAQKPHPAFVG
ncbi:MAG TPA: hypothetical protein VFV48_09020, partial [Pseudomonadales bacterium]|nr:hypothetical protein [Pseudomonadales bacterium]